MQTEHLWTPTGTDITARWRALYNWIPPSELPEYQRKWKYYQELPLRSVDDVGQRAYEAAIKKAKVARIK